MPQQDSQSPSPETAWETEKLTIDGSGPSDIASFCWTNWAMVLLPLGYLWFRLINNLAVEWTTNPQYGYGWAVPFLCLGLFLRRRQSVPERVRGQPPIVCGRWPVVVLLALFGFLYLPTRLIEEATPEWRPVQWALGIETIGLTLCAAFLGRGRGWLRQVAFPVCFFFVAIPWPTLIETPIMQLLTRVNSATAVELLGWTGIPAVQHGNLIEVSTGTVGIDEACSGIRSIQTVLMASLFFGEFYDMRLLRRLILIPAGFVLAMSLNVCRMSFLTTVAAKKGVAAIAQYHDPAGIMITLICMAGLWGLALLFKNSKTAAGGNHEVNVLNSRFLILQRLGFILLLWLVAVEAGTQLWYRGLESHLAPSPKWSVIFPSENPTFRIVPISADTKYLLRFDEGEQGAWVDADGSRWQAFCFTWRPGRVAGYLAKRHTPDVCLPATGRKLLSGPKLTVMNVKNVELPMRSYVFGTVGNPIYVFQCRWEAGVRKSAYVEEESSRFNLIRGIWAGRGNKGQKVLEIVITGMNGPEQAAAALSRELEKLVMVEKQ
jgi:exosortase